MDRILERHPLSALWGDMPSDELAAMRESVQDHGFTDPVIWTYDGSVLDGWHRYTIANLLNLDLEVREYDGDPVQWVIGKNLHRRHLTALQRASCGNAAREWANQGHQQVMQTERDKDTGQFTDRQLVPSGETDSPSLIQTDSDRQLVPSGETDSPSLIQADSGQSEQEPFFTQSERAAFNEVDVRTQKRAERYEEAGLGPEIRSGAISGAEAERIVQNPDAPKPPSQLQQLKMKLEAKTLECQTEHLPTIDTLQRELREAKAQVSEYPHEREAVANEREVIISAQSSSISELQMKLNDEKRRASWFEKQARSLGWEPTSKA